MTRDIKLEAVFSTLGDHFESGLSASEMIALTVPRHEFHPRVENK